MRRCRRRRHHAIVDVTDDRLEVVLDKLVVRTCGLLGSATGVALNESGGALVGADTTCVRIEQRFGGLTVYDLVGDRVRVLFIRVVCATVDTASQLHTGSLLDDMRCFVCSGV